MRGIYRRDGLYRSCVLRAFSISKSTVHKDVSERLRFIDVDLFEKVREVLSLNLSERHIRGGLATKHKYQKDEIK
jgi:putative DeoR family transcriptional regulator (stage III sporulation protein D)